MIVGILGVKGAGKDTAGEILVKEHGFVRLAFADPLYREVSANYRVDEARLRDRAVKEKPIPELALAKSSDSTFRNWVVLQVADEALGLAASLIAPRSPRWTLQMYGQWRRTKYGADYWANQVRSEIVANPGTRFVITDVRMTNEADLLEHLGAVLLRVRRAEVELQEAQNRAAGGTAAHVSETELLHRETQAEIWNEEGNPDAMRGAMFDLVAVAYSRRAA